MGFELDRKVSAGELCEITVSRAGGDNKPVCHLNGERVGCKLVRKGKKEFLEKVK